MKARIFAVLLALPIVLADIAKAQTNSTGTNFWTTFPHDWIIASPFRMSIFVSGPTAATGTVSIAGLGYSSNFTLTAGSNTSVELDTGAMVSVYDTITNLGIHITSSQPVSVSGLYNSSGASEAFLVYPTGMLGTNYCVMAHYSQTGGFESQFAIVATISNTMVTIYPSAGANIPNHVSSFSTNLQTGQVIMWRSGTSIFDIPGSQNSDPMSTHPTDLTGTMVISDKPIVVIGGDPSSHIPGGFCCSNPLAEEQLPVNAWGTQALGFPFANGSPTKYRVLAAFDNTIVSLNGSNVAALQKGQYYDTNSPDPVAFVANYPIQVAAFSQSGGGANYDPTMVLLTPTNRYLTNYSISTPAGDPLVPFETNFLNLIALTSALNNTRVDGVLATNLASFTVISNTGFSGAQIPRAPGSHTVTSSAPVGVIAYGFGSCDAYGYNAGMKYITLQAFPDSYSVAQNTLTSLDVLSNDVFSNRNNVTVTMVTGPAHGSYQITAGKNVDYTPTNGYSGADQFVYQISEQGSSSTTTVTLAVNNHPPVAVDDYVVAKRDLPIVINVLTNDTDSDGNALSLQYVGQPTHGSALGNQDNTVTYRHSGFDYDPDSFTYSITDSHGGTASATVHLTINDPPVAQDDSVTTAPGTAITIPVLANDSDPNSDSMTIISVSGATYGTPVINSGSTNITYTPSAGVTNATDVFTYTITDGHWTNSASVFVTIINSTITVSHGYHDIIVEGGGWWGGSGFATFTFTRTPPYNNALTVYFRLGGAEGDYPEYTAFWPTDFVEIGAEKVPVDNFFSVTISAGWDHSDIAVHAETDDEAEFIYELLNLSLYPDPAYIIGSPNETYVWVQDIDQ